MKKRTKQRQASPQQLLLKLSEQDRERLDALVGRFDFLSHTSLATAAMRLGLAAIEREPAVLVSEKR